MSSLALKEKSIQTELSLRDLSPISLSVFYYSDYALRFREPLTLSPTSDETGELICLVEPQLGIDVCALSRHELDEELHAEMDVLWRNYARADNARLTPEARRLKARLVAAIEEVPSAAR